MSSYSPAFKEQAVRRLMPAGKRRDSLHQNLENASCHCSPIACCLSILPAQVLMPNCWPSLELSDMRLPRRMLSLEPLPEPMGSLLPLETPDLLRLPG